MVHNLKGISFLLQLNTLKRVTGTTKTYESVKTIRYLFPFIFAQEALRHYTWTGRNAANRFDCLVEIRNLIYQLVDLAVYGYSRMKCDHDITYRILPRRNDGIPFSEMNVRQTDRPIEPSQSNAGQINVKNENKLSADDIIKMMVVTDQMKVNANAQPSKSNQIAPIIKSDIQSNPGQVKKMEVDQPSTSQLNVSGLKKEQSNNKNQSDGLNVIQTKTNQSNDDKTLINSQTVAIVIKPEPDA